MTPLDAELSIDSMRTGTAISYAGYSRYASFKTFLIAFFTVFAVITLNAQTNFATLVSDGAWTWYNDPRALFHNGKLYFGYVRSNGKSALSVFNLSTGKTTDLWDSGFTQIDDHNNPGLLAKQDGRLLAIYSRHNSDQFFAYRTSISTNPTTSSDWNAEQTITNSGAGMTYANPFQLSLENGKIYNFCRNTNFNPTIYLSTNGGSSWSAPLHFIRTGSGSTRPYVKYSSDYNDRIDFLYTDGHPRDATNSLYHLYYRAGSFYQTDGTLVKSFANLPLLHSSGERGPVIYQYSDAAQSDPNQWIPTGRAWCWETAYQSNGAPVCVFTVQRDLVTGSTNGVDDRIYYYYARWTGSVWQKRFIAHAGRPLYATEDDYAGGICVDPQNPNVIYISSNAADPFNLTNTTNVPLRANERYELWRGVTVDGGLTFSWTQITTNSAVDNLRPYIPRRNGGEPCVIWFRGTYATYSSYSCAVVGLFTSQIPTNTPPATRQSKVTYVDALAGLSGNTRLSAGTVFSPPLNGTTGADNDWEERTVFGSSGNIFESGGEASENAPELEASIGGLIPGLRYRIHTFFWDATGSSEHWNIRAGFNSAPGSNTLFAAADGAPGLNATPGVLASTLDYTNAPTLFIEGNRFLHAALIGTNTADANGMIKVFVDDKPTTIGGNNRTWFDGLGYTALISTNAVILSASISDKSVTISWPVDHLGWVLQTQSTTLSSDEWHNVPGSNFVTSTNFAFNGPTSPTFFRLSLQE